MKKILVLFLLVSFAANANPEENLYFYKAIPVAVYDGDTIRADIDCGMGVWIKNKPFRLDGIDAPEVKGDSKPAGLASRNYLRSIIKGDIIIETKQDKTEKYGRYLAILWIKGKGDWCPKTEWCNINDKMVKAGHAIYKTY